MSLVFPSGKQSPMEFMSPHFKTVTTKAKVSNYKVTSLLTALDKAITR